MQRESRVEAVFGSWAEPRNWRGPTRLLDTSAENAGVM